MRLPNFLILAGGFFIIFILHYVPAFRFAESELRFSRTEFFLFILVGILLMLFGYLQNDLIDRISDQQNHRFKFWVQAIPTGHLKLVLWVLIFLPLPICVYLAYKSGHSTLLFIYPLILLLISSYNRYLKRSVVLGNVAVALLCASPFLITPFIEFDAFTSLASSHTEMASSLLALSLGYALIAFFGTLAREIIKDILDVHGDRIAGYRNLAIQYGNRKAGRIASLSYFILILSLLGFWNQFSSCNSLPLFLCILFIPALLITIGIWNASGPKQFARLSLVCKLHFASGLVYLFFFKICYSGI